MSENLTNLQRLNFIKGVLRHTHEWQCREQDRYEFHPVILNVIEKYNPLDIVQLVFEWPHMSVRDASNVAYTQDTRAGENDRQQVTTFGRYLRRHFPELKDHEIRDYATKCQNDLYEVWDTPEAIVRSVIRGPKSCMSWDSDCYNPDHPAYSPSANPHPYLVYAPSLGWRSVVRLHPETRAINGRALVHIKDDQKVFVRTYKRGTDYSHSDEALQMWLRENGYEHLDSWPDGTPISAIKNNNRWVLPYIDGEYQNVTSDVCSDGNLHIDCDGTLEATSTDGFAYNDDDSEFCECCECYVDPDDMVSVVGSFDQVCQSCLEDNFTEARTRHGWQYVDNNQAILLECDEYVYEDDMDRLTVVELADGGYDYESNTIRSEEGDYYLEDEYPDEFVKINNTLYSKDSLSLFYCNSQDEFFLHEEFECVTVDGVTYCKDHEPETEESN